MTKRKIDSTEIAERLDDIIAWAKSRKAHIETDSRFKDDPADVFINAPLALVQVDLKAERRVLSAVLNIAKGKYRDD